MNKIYAKITSDVVLCPSTKADQYERAGAPNRSLNDPLLIPGCDQKKIHTCRGPARFRERPLFLVLLTVPYTRETEL
jgi:hypothetical protein